jgi:hypothetical protein
MFQPLYSIPNCAKSVCYEFAGRDRAFVSKAKIVEAHGTYQLLHGLFEGLFAIWICPIISFAFVPDR